MTAEEARTQTLECRKLIDKKALERQKLEIMRAIQYAIEKGIFSTRLPFDAQSGPLLVESVEWLCAPGYTVKAELLGEDDKFGRLEISWE